MRRYTGSLSVRLLLPGWCGSAPVSVPIATWLSVRHNTSKFWGRKPSGTKKLSDAGPTAAPGGSSSDAVVAEAVTAPADAPPTSPLPATATESSPTDSAVSDSSKRRPRYPKKSRTTAISATSSASPSSAPANTNTNATITSTSASASATASAGKERQSAEAKPRRRGSAVVEKAAAVAAEVSVDEEELVAERASITKLFMVSDSVASIFCAMPQDQRSIDNYLKEVDRAVIPKHANAAESDGEAKSSENDKSSNSVHSQGGSSSSCNAFSKGEDSGSNENNNNNLQNDEATATREIAQRVLSEERADYSLCIHVRDMEQLVPPRHLLHDAAPLRRTSRRANATNSSSSSDASAENGTQRRGRKAARAALSPIARVMALQQWQAAALARSRATQQRYQVPEEYHAITRVRFNDPFRTDVSVVQGCGGNKSVNDVLRIMNLSWKGVDPTMYEAKDDGETLSDETPPAQLPTFFAVKPLLSVFASCIPRREPALGARSGEENINTAAPSSAHTTRRGKLREETPAVQQVPPVPRHTTRVTVLVEHDQLEPVDLLSMAERSTPRKDSDKNSSDGKSAAAARSWRKHPQIYCLIADGGEF